MLLSVAPQVHVCMILDTCGCQTILDPAGTGSVWTFIKGVKQKGLWPLLTDPTNRMQRASYNSNVWLDPRHAGAARAAAVVPALRGDLLGQRRQVSCPLRLQAAHWQQQGLPLGSSTVEPSGRRSSTSFSRTSSSTFSRRASPLRALHHGLRGRKASGPRLLGVFTWCLVSVLLELFGPANASRGRRVSYQALIDRVRNRMRDLKWNVCSEALVQQQQQQQQQLLQQQPGAASPAAAAAAAARGRGAGGAPPQQGSPALAAAAAAAAAREAYIAAAAKHISDKASAEAALGAASNAAYQAHLRKLQDVAPQASELARLVMQQQLAAQQQQQQQQGGPPGPPGAPGGPPGARKHSKRGLKEKKIPIYDASPPPIYEATPD
ncbi:ICE-like protease (caspase) p20 domain-containing protein, putative [Eimeria necatrix]|uniref:ICE-like protease (Caspase) p20 domain-containing protein, putative n=1 Tax=Eimeria necatrix TaxID=51315 RepID=U6MXJ7_9EIME|nr:ICE-like protease (caspase) p20 domain-containing protein, putative [Eimeria necatrix]CDJ68977.1 ICE-like protease (caspase) p20 domain-containing protein, putative [Eimeria necatrix]